MAQVKISMGGLRIRTTARVAAILACVAGTCALSLICMLSYRDYGVWSIGVYSGSSPYDLSPVGEHPALSPASVTDVHAKGVADPFMLRARDGIWYMFFEVISDQGDIGYASSLDCTSWKYEGRILDEPFHLSYPCVFEHEDTYYMIPESAESHEVRLYKATEFPGKWVFQQKLLDGDYADPTILRHEGAFYLFASQGDNLTLHMAKELTGPYVSHPESPIVKSNKRVSRQAGRLVGFGDQMLRFAQDGTEAYGRQVIALEVAELSPWTFSERETEKNPILTASGYGWNQDGMHQIDLHETDGNWYACVDGKRNVKRFDLRYGYRKAKHMVKEVLTGKSDD